ncbi:hypothetical protein GCM10010320_28820 [Streptomyces caelestis]|nr:hypothetical protein GCM10010320_28820 [Streptomyces caelestis]
MAEAAVREEVLGYVRAGAQVAVRVLEHLVTGQSPIVVGAVACVQGVLEVSDRSPLDGWQVRDLLRNTGWPQQDAPGRPATQRIGNRPDLSQLIPAALA